MQALFNIALAISVASAAVVPRVSSRQTHFCGASAPTPCANITEATGPKKVVNGQYVDNQMQYINWPTVFTYQQCQAACQEEDGCLSFQYEVTQGGGLTGATWRCHLLYKPVSDYAIQCSADETTSVETFFDVGCNSLPTYEPGPIATNTTGTCDTSRTVGDFSKVFSSEMFYANVSHADCKELCLQTEDCRSYWSTKFSAPVYYERYDGSGYYPKDDGSVSKGVTGASDPPACLLLNQPVREYTSTGDNIFVQQFYDVKCPISENDP